MSIQSSVSILNTHRADSGIFQKDHTLSCEWRGSKDLPGTQDEQWNSLECDNCDVLLKNRVSILRPLRQESHSHVASGGLSPASDLEEHVSQP